MTAEERLGSVLTQDRYDAPGRGPALPQQHFPDPLGYPLSNLFALPLFYGSLPPPCRSTIRHEATGLSTERVTVDLEGRLLNAS